MSSADNNPQVHRDRERAAIEHVLRLVRDERLRVDTRIGRRPVTQMIARLERTDRSLELKRLMSEAGKPDRELAARMPQGESIDLALFRKRLFVFRQLVGRVKVICVSPVRAMLTDQPIAPLKSADVQRVLSETPPALGNVPQTIVLVSTSGFAPETHELADRRVNRTLILVEPNAAGGWTVHGPPETQSLADLFDPEQEAEKTMRVRKAIEARSADVSGAGVAADRLASVCQLPLGFVEEALKRYAKENTGLTAKRLDGRVVLFRESAASTLPAPVGVMNMPIVDAIKLLFSRKGETEKKIAFLAERRAALGQQRDRMYEEIGSVESREASLKKEFADAGSQLTQRRITSQLLQLRKEIERRQQLMAVLNQQINVVGTHLHHLELAQQGQTAGLPDSDEMATDAARAEEVLADLEASSELADSVGAVGTMGMSAEEQALFEELQLETGKAKAPAVMEKTAVAAPAQAQQSTTPAREPRIQSPAKQPEPG